MKKLSNKSMVFECPVDAQEEFVKAHAADNLMETYARIPFCYKLALRASLECEKHRREGWSMIKALNPKLNDRQLSYSDITRLITVKEKTNGAK